MSSNSIGEVYFALCKSVDTPRSLCSWMLYHYNEHEQLAKLTISPGDYTSPDAFRFDYLVTSFLSKYKGLETGINTAEVALAAFHEAEERCKASNKRLAGYRNGGQDPQLSGIFHAAQRKIAKLLGPFSVFCVAGDERWGPHAALDVARRQASIDLKMTKIPFTVTRAALPHFRNAIEQDLHWSAAILGSFPDGPYSLLPTVFDIVEHARLETVPKSAKTDRVIAVEPRGNGFMQKAVGAYIRNRLRRVGIDLNDQSRNQDAARRGVADGLATLDLRGASDTICQEIVYDLLPLDWAMYLDDLRSKYALLPTGEKVRLHKFSSMGNGFTFELESLIFWALCRASTDIDSHEGEVLVYGDDLVVPVGGVDRLVRCLIDAGFEVNDQKSFSSESIFRESCGSHFFGEHDVTPIYQKELVSDDREVVRLGNRVIRAALRFGEGLHLDSRLQNAWLASRRLAVRSHCFCLPLGASGDDGWATRRSDFRSVRYDPNQGYRVRIMQPMTITLPGDPCALLAYSLRSRSLSSSSKGYADDLSFAKDSWSPSHRWIHATKELDLNW